MKIKTASQPARIGARLLLTLSIGAILVASPSQACLNDGLSAEYVRSIGEDEQFTGQFRTGKKGYPALLQTPFTKADWELRARSLERQIKNKPQPDIDLLTAYGVALVHNGAYKHALAVFLDLETKRPGLYPNAANLGTTYELLGDNASALRWIREGLNRYPGSHQGTEWLHVKILEAKIELERDPQWLETHSVSGWNWGQDVKPLRPEGLTDEKAIQLNLALHHQLHERIEFVKSPDPIVGQLLSDLANLAILADQPVFAVDLWKFSLSYFPPEQELVRRRITAYRMDAWIARAAASPQLVLGTLILSAGSGILLIAIVLWRRKSVTA